MRSVKFLVGLCPKSLREWLKKSPTLHEFYARSLQRSGLFYGFPSPQKLQVLYSNLIKSQTFEINELVKGRDLTQKVDIFLVINDDMHSALGTITQLLKNDYVENIHLVGNAPNCIKISVKTITTEGVNRVSLLDRDLYSQKNQVLLIRAGDTIHENLIPLCLIRLLDTNFENEFFYCDCDYLENNGKRYNAELLPDWNPDLQLSTGYIKTGVFLSGQKVVDDFIRFSNSKGTLNLISSWVVSIYLNKLDINIEHIAFSLLHQSPNAIDDWDFKVGQANHSNFTKVANGFSSVTSLQWHYSTDNLVSLIIPTKNSHDLVEKCINSILTKTSYKNFEILLIDNNSDDSESLKYFDELNKHPQIRVLKFPYPFNYSAINNFAMEHATGDIIGLVNNDVEVITPDWLSLMVGHVLRDDIGCVGAKLLYPDGRIQHAGVVMGYGGGAGHAHKYFPRYHPGYMNRLVASQNFSAVTAACLLVKKADYQAVGGLDEKNLTVAFNDVDFCLKVLQLGKRNLYCAEAELFHHESVSRGLDLSEEKRQRFENELSYIQTKWSSYIKKDPAYNSNLTLRRENFAIRD